MAARTVRGYQRVAARMDVRNIKGLPFDAGLRWQDDQLTQEDFYGFGSGSTQSGRTNYRLDSSEYGATVAWRPIASLTIGGDLSLQAPLIGEGTDARYPTTQSIYDVADVPGLSDLPSFVRTGVAVAFDWRDSETHPRRGGHYRAALSQASGVHDAAYDYRRVDIAAQQIVPLGNHYRRISLSAAAAFTDAIGNGGVPFIYQPSIGGLRTLRGFDESRFRDRHAAWARAEYQWEAWWALDAAFFVDAGQVAAHLSDFRFNDVEVGYGIGFRLHASERVIAGLDLAYGREGFVPILGFKYGF
jgi:outer membrane protein assembly factor BamA